MGLRRNRFGLPLEPFARAGPESGEGDALRAILIAGERAEILQFGDGPFWIQHASSSQR